MRNPDIANSQTAAEVLVPSSHDANVNGAAVDLRAYTGTVQVLTHSGNTTAGDNNSTFVVTLLDSADNNISNAASIGTNITATNVGSLQTTGVDTRAVKRFLFAQGNIAGANSPAFPISVSLTGETKYSS